MIRETFKKISWDNKEFDHRGTEPGRLENISDACFALAIALLLISTSPPTTYPQLRRFIFDLIPFIFCITLIVSIWYQHFIFFYRYGIRNAAIVVYNSVFL